MRFMLVCLNGKYSFVKFHFHICGKLIIKSETFSEMYAGKSLTILSLNITDKLTWPRLLICEFVQLVKSFASGLIGE